MVTLEFNSSKEDTESPEDRGEMKKKRLSYSTPPQYGSISEDPGDTCPTCRGIGRIPRGENQLVAVIPCNDVRLKPKRTKLYVCISMIVCLFLSCLILFFLFPRSITITPVSVQSVMVYFTPKTVDMEVTNIIRLQNENYVSVQIVQFYIQAVVLQTVLSKTKISNISSIQPRSQELNTIRIDLSLEDKGLNNYCKSSSIKVHTLLLELQMTMNVSYLSHIEQLSLDAYEYIDCGKNSTIPHPLR